MLIRIRALHRHYQVGSEVRLPYRRPTDAERKRFVDLEKRRNHRAGELDIDPTLIASRATLSDLAQNWDKHVIELMKWQRELLQG